MARARRLALTRGRSPSRSELWPNAFRNTASAIVFLLPLLLRYYYHVEISIRLPEELRAIEMSAREAIGAKIKRGKIFNSDVLAIEHCPFPLVVPCIS